MVLSLKNISKSYNSNKVLEDVSFSIPEGDIFTLCGHSGSGKTTLVNIISGLIGFDEGTLRIKDNAISHNEIYPKSLYGKIGVIFQNHNLFPHLTILENITIGLIRVKKLSKKDAHKRAELELNNLGLINKRDNYPAHLSGGELQRAAIARSLAMDPLLLLLDEPTSNLDPLRIDDVLSTIESLSDKKVTMLLISHNLDFAKAIGNTFGIIIENKLNVSKDKEILNELRGKYLRNTS